MLGHGATSDHKASNGWVQQHNVRGRTTKLRVLTLLYNQNRIAEPEGKEILPHFLLNRYKKWWGTWKWRKDRWMARRDQPLPGHRTRAVDPHSRSAIPDTDRFQSSYPGMRFLLNVFLCRLHRLFYSCSADGFSILPRAPAGRAAPLSSSCSFSLEQQRRGEERGGLHSSAVLRPLLNFLRGDCRHSEAYWRTLMHFCLWV